MDESHIDGMLYQKIAREFLLERLGIEDTNANLKLFIQVLKQYEQDVHSQHQ